MKRIKYLFINIGKLIAFPFILVWEDCRMMWELLTESPEETEARESRMLHDHNIFGR